jgi:hypothetical protein
VDAVAVKVAAGSVVVLGGSRIRMSREDLGIAEWDSGVEALVIAAWRSECGLM